MKGCVLMDRETYLEINLDNINNNVKNIIDSYKGYDYYIAVVKGNVYGHGNYTVKEMIASGINYLAVSSLTEAINIRTIDNNIPILCLEPIDIKYIEDVIKFNITLTI